MKKDNSSPAAVIDVGTNSIKLVVGELDENGSLRVLLHRTANTRLGEGIDTNGFLSSESQNRTIEAILGFIHVAKEFGANYINIIGTSAMRDASNALKFIDRLKNESGCTLKILSEEDEGRLSFIGASLDPSLGGYSEVQAVVDVGGGSTEVTVGKNGTIIFSKSIRLGAVRLTERYLHSDPPTNCEYVACTDYIEKLLVETYSGLNIKRIIAVGGSAVNLGRMIYRICPEKTLEIHGKYISSDQIDNLIHSLIKMTVEEKKKVVGLEAERADIIVAGISILKCLVKHFHTDGLIISTRGLRHGMLYELLLAGLDGCRL